MLPKLIRILGVRTKKWRQASPSLPPSPSFPSPTSSPPPPDLSPHPSRSTPLLPHPIPPTAEPHKVISSFKYVSCVLSYQLCVIVVNNLHLQRSAAEKVAFRSWTPRYRLTELVLAVLFGSLLLVCSLLGYEGWKRLEVFTWLHFCGSFCCEVATHTSRRSLCGPAEWQRGWFWGAWNGLCGGDSWIPNSCFGR